MEFQILDVDYILVDEKPIIRLFGKGTDGSEVCIFYDDFRPFIYARGRGTEKALKDRPEVVKIKEVKRNIIGSRELQQIYKVMGKNPAKTPELREYLKSVGVTTYEADILFRYRFINDMDLSPMGWAKVTESNGIATTTVTTKNNVKADKIEAVAKDANAPLKYLAFDIECVSPDGGMPDAKKDPVILISMVFDPSHKGRKSVVLSTRPGKGVDSFENEKEMLEGFIDAVKKYDPDIITGYNCKGFDFPYILDRMKKQGVRPFFGRCTQKPVFFKKFGNNCRVSITGRIIVDSFEIIKKDFSLQRYGLDFVAQELLKEKKGDVKHSEIDKLWRGSAKEFEKLVYYSRQDSVLAMNLLLKLNLLDKYVALSKVSGTLLQDTLDSGETTRIENYMLREFNKHKFVMPCKPDFGVVSSRSDTRKKELGGGEVLEPKKGLHSSVLVLDFKSMYPSIVKTFNICPTTKLKDTEKAECYTTPSGARFFKKSVKKGIVPKIVETLMENRQEVKKKLKRAKGEKARQLYAKQWALKIMANAIYGYFGYVRSRLFDLDIANAITSTGRNTILNTKKDIETKYGYEVVYGDTDSVFVKLKEEDMEKIAAIGDDISKYITDKLPGSMELEFEKVFKRFLPLTKKRYAAWKFVREGDGWEEGIEMKGIETVRRDWCNLVGLTLRDVIEIILKESDVKGAVKHFKEIITKLLRNEIAIDNLVITKTMTKAPKHYAGVQPHIELVKKIQARDPTAMPGIGDRIGYVIVKGTQMLSKRTEDPRYVTERGLQVDSNYYIENQLLPPLERIFGALGISKSELLGNGKQTGIMDVLRAQTAVVKKEETKEIPKEDVNGFICSRCNRFYPRVPLMGVCECGGKMKFSSASGPAELAVS